MNTSTLAQSENEFERTTQQFVIWALTTLGLQCWSDDGYLFHCAVPESEKKYFGNIERLIFSTNPKGIASLASNNNVRMELIGINSTLVAQIAARLRVEGPWVHAMPAEQPVSIHAITPHLFRAFRVRGGSVQLAGCTLEDRPIVRLTYGCTDTKNISKCGLTHVYASQDDTVIDVAATKVLGLENLVPLDRKTSHLRKEEIEYLLSSVKRDSACKADHWKLLATTIVWCKYAEGKLALIVGKYRAEVSFAGWARHLATGGLKPPPFCCPVTGIESYDVAATDDGQIVAADSIVECDYSGRRTTENDLLTCPITGRRALAEFFTVCPVSGERVFAAALVPCPTCEQYVSPRSIKNNGCVACHSLKTVRKEDPRMARLLGEYPVLDHWGRWKIFETSRVYILTAVRLVSRLLLVVEKQTLQPQRVATTGRFSSVWANVSDLQREELLGK